ncbi:hypothetical protein E2C01_092563 [Portunus trituberculatus]|uniref:Uncharacterized protein n=1 Tax=Portunus trituberculatus TaxID=210409 RepID=A0A5B7JQW6_PORTR|nr:hypothetical protein [Portunus trituberculatus]
MYCSGSPLN